MTSTTIPPPRAPRQMRQAEPPRRAWRTRLFGRPLSTADAPHQAIGKAVGLAVFASDALSSTAYATQEILIILAAAGTAAFAYAFPISIAIVALLAIVTISYQQTIHAYPGGGGAYIVARDNLGELPAQIAGGALLTDYILTVAVSVSSGVAQITSAFPAVFGHRVALSVFLVLLVGYINLRGVKESGAIFAVPTYFFIGMMLLTVGLAFFRFSRDPGVGGAPPPETAGGSAVPAPRLLERHHCPHRRRGHLERHHRLQGAALPNAITHLDVLHPGPFLGHLHLSHRRRPRRADRISQLARTPLAAGRPLPRHHRGHHADPGDGGQHRLADFPSLRTPGRGRLPAAAAHLPRQPPRLLPRDRAAGHHRLPSHRRLQRQRHALIPFTPSASSCLSRCRRRG